MQSRMVNKISDFLCEIHQRKTTKEIFWSVLSKASASVLFIGLNIYLARFLGADIYGKWSFLFSVITVFIWISSMGINGSIKKHIAQYSYANELGSVLRDSIKLRLYFSIGFLILVMVVGNPLFSLLGRPELGSLLFISAPMVFFASLVEGQKAAFQGLHRLKFNFILTFAEFSLKFLFVYLLLKYTVSLKAIVISFNLAFFLSFLIGAILLHVWFIKKHKAGLRSFDKEILRYSFPLIILSVGFIVVTETDTIMLGVLSVDSEIGIYAAAKQIIIKIPHIAVALSMGTAPVFARIDHANFEKVRSMYKRLIRINNMVFGVIGLFILAGSWFFLPLIYGPDYVGSVKPMMILVPFMIFFSYSVFQSAFLDYQGKAKKRAFNLSFSMVLNILLNLVLIPRYGATGAAIATSISFIPYAILNFFVVRKTFAEIKQ